MMKSRGMGAINRSKMGKEQKFAAGGLSNQDEMTLLLARKGEVSRGQAFQAARRLKLQEFDWKDPQTGKTGKYHTRMAGEAPPRPAGGISVPKGMKESDIYRDVDYENRLREIDKEYQQGLRNIEADSALRSLRDQEAYERQESLIGEANQHLAALRQQEKEQRAAESLGDLADYERREASESALGELADYERREREQSKMGELHRDVANYENDLRMAHLVGSAKPLERVYPEAALPLTRLGRLLGGSAPKRRQEPRLDNLDKLRPQKRVEPYYQGGSVAGASRGDGIAQRGKTRGKYL